MAEELHEIARLTGVAKLYGTFAALRPLSLSLEAGKIYLVLGENGAGKSTLLRLLAGLAEPSRGLGDGCLATRRNGRRGGGSPTWRMQARCMTSFRQSRTCTILRALHRTEASCACVGSPEMALRAVGLDPGAEEAGGAVFAGNAAAGIAGESAADGPGAAAAG